MRNNAQRGAVLAAALFAGLLPASPGLAGPVSVTDPWLRALPDNLPAGGYFTLHNETDKTVALIGASSPACGMVMLHKSEEMSGMSTMSDVSSIPVAPGGTLAFAPGGYHLMCMNPTDLLKQAETVKEHAVVPITLYFGDGTKIGVPFAVRSASGR